MTIRNVPETASPMIVPALWTAGGSATTTRVATTSATVKMKTIAEWPRENHVPTVNGRCPSWSNFRVVLSIADVIGIHTVPQAEGVRDEPEPREDGGDLADDESEDETDGRGAQDE